MIKCPHCKESLVIRCYYERYVDHPAIKDKDGTLFYDDSDCVRFSDDYNNDEFDDFECANCKENVKNIIGRKV